MNLKFLFILLLISFVYTISITNPNEYDEELKDWESPSKSSHFCPCKIGDKKQSGPASARFQALSSETKNELDLRGFLKSALKVKVSLPKLALPKIKMCPCGISLPKIKLPKIDLNLKIPDLKVSAGIKGAISIALKPRIRLPTPQPPPLPPDPPPNPIPAPPFTWTCCRLCPERFVPAYDQQFGVLPPPPPPQQPVPTIVNNTIQPPQQESSSTGNGPPDEPLDPTAATGGSSGPPPQQQRKTSFIEQGGFLDGGLNFNARAKVNLGGSVSAKARISAKVGAQASTRPRRPPPPPPTVLPDPPPPPFTCCPICPGYGTPTFQSGILLELRTHTRNKIFDDKPSDKEATEKFHPPIPPCCDFCEEVYYPRDPYQFIVGLPNPVVSVSDYENNGGNTDPSIIHDDTSIPSCQDLKERRAVSGFVETFSESEPSMIESESQGFLKGGLKIKAKLNLGGILKAGAKLLGIGGSKKKEKKAAPPPPPPTLPPRKSCCHFCPKSCSGKGGKKQLYIPVNIAKSEGLQDEM